MKHSYVEIPYALATLGPFQESGPYSCVSSRITTVIHVANHHKTITDGKTKHFFALSHAPLHTPEPSSEEGERKEAAVARRRAVELQAASEVKYNRSAQSFTSSLQSSRSQESPAGVDEIGQPSLRYSVMWQVTSGTGQ